MASFESGIVREQLRQASTAILHNTEKPTDPHLQRLSEHTNIQFLIYIIYNIYI